MSRLMRADRRELERLFAAASPALDAPIAARRFEGQLLTRVASGPLAALVTAPFERWRFGIDFATYSWFLIHPRLRVGRFRLAQAPSKWRDTEVLALHYDVSRLPGIIERRLYDEIKPLGPTLHLGLGGIRAAGGERELFFFALEARG